MCCVYARMIFSIFLATLLTKIDYICIPQTTQEERNTFHMTYTRKPRKHKHTTQKRRGNNRTKNRLKKLFFVLCLTFVAAIGIVATAYFVFPDLFYSAYYKVADTYRPKRNEPYNGIDVSHHNGKIDWQTVATDKRIEFAYIKATEGFKHPDKRFSQNTVNARKAGIKVGAYHLLTTKTAMKTQFDYFTSVVDKHEQDLIPMLDIEEKKMRRWSREQIQDSIAKFIQLAENHYGVSPVIYCSHKFYKHYLSPRFDNYILFLARYSESQPILENNKKHHDIWQFTEHGHINGIKGDVDLDRFGPNTTLQDLLL